MLAAQQQLLGLPGPPAPAGIFAGARCLPGAHYRLADLLRCNLQYCRMTERDRVIHRYLINPGFRGPNDSHEGAANDPLRHA